MATTTTQQIPDDELSPKEVVEKILVVKNALIRNWQWLLLLPAVGFGIGYAMPQWGL